VSDRLGVKQDIAAIARAMLLGHTPLLEGCRWIHAIHHDLAEADRSNQDLLYVAYNADDLDDVPTGPNRAHWEPAALAEKEQKRDDHFASIKEELTKALQSLASWDAEKWNLADAFASFSEPWRPKVVATANGQDVRIVKTRGLFPWHRHESAAEVFLCWRGVFRVEFRDRVVELRPGELVTVPPGVEHRTGSDEEAEVIIFEPSDVVNTGDAQTSEFTAPRTVLG